MRKSTLVKWFALGLILGAWFSFARAEAADFRFGPYAGVVVGYNSSQISAEGVDINGDGALASGLAGINLNGGDGFVFGLEGDFGYSGVSGSVSNGGGTVKSSGDWNGSVRARAGFLASPSTLIFGTAGVAFQNDKAAAASPAAGASDSAISTGFVGGGGIDMQITNTIKARFEALEYIYPSETFSFATLGSGSIDHRDTVVRAGIVFDLN